MYRRTARVFIVRWNLKEAVSKSLVRQTEIAYKAKLREVSWHKHQVNSISKLPEKEGITEIQVVYISELPETRKKYKLSGKNHSQVT